MVLVETYWEKKMIEAPKKIYRWGWKGRDIMRPSR